MGIDLNLGLSAGLASVPRTQAGEGGGGDGPVFWFQITAGQGDIDPSENEVLIHGYTTSPVYAGPYGTLDETSAPVFALMWLDGGSALASTIYSTDEELIQSFVGKNPWIDDVEWPIDHWTISGPIDVGGQSVWGATAGSDSPETFVPWVLENGVTYRIGIGGPAPAP